MECCMCVWAKRSRCIEECERELPCLGSCHFDNLLLYGFALVVYIN